MSDLSGSIGAILGDPAMMDQIRQLGAALGLEDKPASGNEARSGPVSSPAPNAEMLGAVMKLAPLLSSMEEETESTRLLSALRPFLGQRRQERLDGSLRILRLMRLLPALKEAF